ncbi:hypothetical protein JOC77_002849 [Peribacillus deserti]|uniref:DNA mismatch repair protein MutT n=1 Tax=Peribacillus deserti TaxID=673318 RepID=A0ABS2QL03_9BACI|nr:hypothetical protein [Peribacillus deserti]MBM7693409.1 hypothetical protein [Peribacillus deserti]
MDSGMKKDTKYTITGTDIEEVKRLNRNSGLSYNQAKEMLAKQYHSKNK